MSWQRDFVHGEEVVRVAVRAAEAADQFEVFVGDRRCEVTARRLPDGRVAFELDGVAHVAAAVLVRGAGGAPDLQARVDGRTWALRAHSSSRGSGSGAASGAVVAPMTGTVLAIEVKVGDRVEVGVTVAVVTAMKMEHKLAAGIEGEVVEIAAVAGDNVDEGALLVRIE